MIYKVLTNNLYFCFSIFAYMINMFFLKRKLNFLFLFSLILPTVLSAQKANSPAQSLANLVNPFTGDFQYSIPLLNIPGPNGEEIPVTLSYAAGISMEAKASWVGLGWNYNPGEISRSVNGIPDDWNGVVMMEDTMKKGSTASFIHLPTKYYGPIYYKNFVKEPNSGMDIHQISAFLRKSPEPFEEPNYDTYQVSGPGVQGQIRPRILQYCSLIAKDTVQRDTLHYDNQPDYVLSANSFKSKGPYILPTDRVNFSFINTDVAVGPAYYKEEQNQNNARIGSDNVNYSLPNTTTNSRCIGINYNLPNSRILEENFIKYYTNAELNASNLPNFIDYRSYTGFYALRRNASDFAADDIGAFAITDGNGITYHYSLPVYTNSDTVLSFEVNKDFTLNTSGKITRWYKTKRYVSSWKLTAITGPDFNDVNGNHYPDEGDKGYWIRYDYGLWTANSASQYPYYGYESTLAMNNLPSWYKYIGSGDEVVSTNELRGNRYYNGGTVTKLGKQEYYLNTISSPSHTAFFIKDTRNDDISKYSGTSKPIPSLRLTTIILMSNKDLAANPSLFQNTANTAYAGYDVRFNTANVNFMNVLHTGIYLANKTQIDALSLKSIELLTNYTLCKKNYDNINNVILTSSVDYSANYKGIYEQVTTQAGLYGKLTLQSIRSYERGHAQLFPEYQFDYERDVALSNPDYQQGAGDFWGYYKSDYSPVFRAKYTTMASAANTDAWSLRRITNPNGSVIGIDYESDKYERVWMDGEDVFVNSFIDRVVQQNDGNGYARVEVYPQDESILALLQTTEVIRLSLLLYQMNRPMDGSSFCNTFLQTRTVTLGENPDAGWGYVDLVGKKIVFNRIYNNFSEFNFKDNLNHPGTFCSEQTFSPVSFVRVLLNDLYGGGIRVKRIRIQDAKNTVSYAQEFSYTEGKATYQPSKYALQKGISYPVMSNSASQYQIPMTVGYSQVEMKTIGTDSLATKGKTIFTFHNIDEFNPVLKDVKSQRVYEYFEQNDRFCIKAAHAVETTFPLYGLMKEMKQYDKQGILMAKTINEYGTSESNNNLIERFHSAYTHQSYRNNKQTNDTFYTANYYFERGMRLKYQKNYVDGIETIIRYQYKDPYRNSPTDVITTDPTQGNTFVSNRAAYTTYPEMGSKALNEANANMMSRYAEEKYARSGLDKDANGNYVLGTAVFQDGVSIPWQSAFRKRVFNGTYFVNQVDNTNKKWMPYRYIDMNGNESNSAVWRARNEMTLVSANYRIIEKKDLIQNRYTATKYGSQDQYVLAEGDNVNFSSFTYTGFEEKIKVAVSPDRYYFEGEVSGGEQQQASTLTVKAHSGQYLAAVPGNTYGPGFFIRPELDASNNYKDAGLQRGRTYSAAVWMHASSSNNAKLVLQLKGKTTSGTAVNVYREIFRDDATALTVDNWKLLSLTIDVPSNFTIDPNNAQHGLSAFLWNTDTDPTKKAYFDDFRIQPIDADVTGYVVDPKTGWVKAVIDRYNFSTQYTHDAAGRVVRTYKETLNGLKLVAENEYSDGLNTNTSNTSPSSIR